MNPNLQNVSLRITRDGVGGGNIYTTNDIKLTATDDNIYNIVEAVESLTSAFIDKAIKKQTFLFSV